MQYKLFVLISTIDERILNVKNIIQAPEWEISYVISHQINRELDVKSKNYINSFKNREDITYHVLRGRGVARNRNKTLQSIQPGSISLILDDDVLLCDNALNMVIKTFKENPFADFISFKILDLEGKDYKPYPDKQRSHSLSTLTSIGTTEIAFRSDLILENDIRFDERFGPGSDLYPIGEDFIFAMDIYKANANMLFVPIPIVKHPIDSTGSSLKDKIIFGRGAMFARVFGGFSYVIDSYFAFKHRKRYKERYTLLHYLKLLVQGSRHFLKQRQVGHDAI